jgi:hypothetical protein
LGQGGTATCTKAFGTPGTKTVTAAYLGDPDTVGSSASVGVAVAADWSGPAAAGVTGARDHDPAGFYLGLKSGTANRWQLLVTQPGKDPAGRYSGTITVNKGAFGNVTGVKLEPSDTLTYTPGSSTISFSFTNVDGLDGLTFTTPTAASTLTLDLDLDGSPVKPSEVYLGPRRTPAHAVPVVIRR